jgi:hypothetical protein
MPTQRVSGGYPHPAPGTAMPYKGRCDRSVAPISFYRIRKLYNCSFVAGCSDVRVGPAWLEQLSTPQRTLFRTAHQFARLYGTWLRRTRRRRRLHMP